MPGRSFMREFEDPFFSDHRDQISHMHDMFRTPFAGLGMGMLEDGGRRGRDGGRHDREGGRENSNALAPFDADFGFGSFGKMFENMDKMMKDAQRGIMQTHESNGNGQMYQQASVMSYSNTGNGPPKVFQASHSTRTGPGGVRETRKALKDSERALEKMAIGHHIQDRGHEVERRKDLRTGTMDEHNNFHNLDESEAEAFDREWQEKTRQAFKGLDYGDRRHRRDERRAIPESRQRALPEPDANRSEHWGRTREGSRRDRS